jgi:Family of unknown function (DUF6152)
MNVQRYLRAAAVSAATAVLLTAASALAHHASGPFYDSTKKVEARGKITKFVFMNPHAFLYVDAPDAAGTMVNWQIEMGAPISLRRTGWTPDTMKVGTDVVAVGAPSRAEGTYGMCCARITRPDGSPITPGGRVQEEQQPPR